VTKLFLFALLVIVNVGTYAQHKYFQQEVNYTINVSLNDKEHTLDGFETIEYINHSPDTLQYIWFHLWPNAYKNDKTAFSEQLLKLGRTDFYFSKPADKGYINKLEFKADNLLLTVVADSLNIDIVKLLLPKPLAPGKKTIITTPFHVQLPAIFSRSGHTDNYYQVTQWYPKPAVYDRKGWHPMPYLDQGEFYSEFGNFDVEITAPSAYVIAATGTLQDELTLQQIKQNKKHTATGNNKTWQFKQTNTHDFAWFASKDFTVDYDTVQLASGKQVDVFVYRTTDDAKWKKATAFAKDGLQKYSEWIGEYPYSTASIVQGGKSESSSGMEYPSITVITTEENEQYFDATIAHELGHNWFYGSLASNERQHPWMDEGMNTYYQKRYEINKYGSYGFLSSVPKSVGRKLPDDEEKWMLDVFARMYKDQAIETPSTAFTPLNYGLISYYKASRWLKKLEATIGTAAFDKCMKQYYTEWKFKHPYPDDFKYSIETCTGKDLNDVFIELYKDGPISSTEKKPLKFSLLYNLKDYDKYNYIYATPLLGYNNYDKAMLGAMVHNYTLPLPNFKFLAAGLYATGSSKFNPVLRASYTKYSKELQVNAAISYIGYTQNDFATANETIHLGVKRISPSLKFTFLDKDPTITRRYTAGLQSFFINEDELTFAQVTTPTGVEELVGKESSSRYINRFTATAADSRVLYPYNFTFSADQGKDFIRAGITSKYFFNYGDGKSGMSARLFAGKFFYTTAKTIFTRFRNERYFLNMTGPTGREDYTYSDYFIGRNEFEGWMSQQVMERDGFFKIRTEAREVGNTDDWLVALNLSSDLPGKYNPLSVLPVKIPLKLFLDVGTYAEAWKDNPASGRFIYNAGIQLPLLNSLINVYVPIVYSKVYSDYLKSIVVEKKFLRSISFTINLEQLSFDKLIPSLPL
jgi:hypothetical protein